MIEKLRWWDLQVTFTFNPLNWGIQNEKYGNGVRVVAFGPLQAMILYGG